MLKSKIIKKNNEPEKKIEILSSAIQIFADKGFEEATISEIAANAKISPSGVYSFFNTKEEILFTAINNFFIDGHVNLLEHLNGIEGALNKLRKATWFHCKTYSYSKKEIKIVLEVRSYPNFYKSEAYDSLKKYSKVFSDIIEEGILDLSFNNISSYHILRDIILGTIDNVAINWTLRNGPSPLEVFDQFFDMIKSSIASKNTELIERKKTAEKRKKILKVSTSIFAKAGYKEASTSEIAKAAGVSEATIYDYFKNKENLLVEIPKKKLEKLYKRLIMDDPESDIRRIIYELFRFYNDDHDFSTVLILLLNAKKIFYNSESIDILDNISVLLGKKVNSGQKNGIFKKDLNLSLCSSFLFGSIYHVIIPWIIFGRKYDLLEIGDEVTNIFINAIKS